MGLLPADDIQGIYDAAIATGLASQQEALLAGLPAAYTATLPHSGPPAARLLQTLHALNAVPALADGTVPLVVWLRAAVALSGARIEARIFENALAELQRPAPTTRPAVAVSDTCRAGPVPVHSTAPGAGGAAGAPPPASSRQEFRVRVLHLSDAHFRSDKGALPPERVAQVRREAWKRYRVLGDGFRDEIRRVAQTAPPDIVCFTGDVADWGLPHEYDEATPFFEEMAADAGVPFDRLFLVPGNHDIHRRTNEASWKKLRDLTRAVSVRSLSDWIAGGSAPLGVEPNLRAEVIERQRNYREWLTRLKRGELLPEAHAHGLLGYRVPLTLPGRPFPIHIIGLDSAWLAGDDNDDGKLLLTEDQIGRHSTDNRGRRLDGLRFALMHHPLAQLADHADARRLLADHVDLVLRGHQHDPLADVWTDPDRGLVELAAGCLYEGSEGHRYPNSYTQVEVVTDERGRPLRYELLFRSWSSRGHWHDDGSLYRSATHGRLVVAARSASTPGAAAAPNAAPSAPPTAPPAAAAGGVSIPVNVSGSVIVVGSGNSISMPHSPASAGSHAGAAARDGKTPKLRLTGELAARRAAAVLIGKKLPLRRDERDDEDIYYGSAEFAPMFVYNAVQGLSERTGRDWPLVEWGIIE